MISSLHIRSLRSLDRVEINPDRRVNLISGQNGAGKSSVVEGIVIAGKGSSFRTSRLDEAIQHGASEMIIRVGVADDRFTGHVAIRKRRGEALVHNKVGSEEQVSRRRLAETLPFLVVSSHSFKVIEEGPIFRRSFFDWGMFHVEPRFFEVWSRYRHILKQRNAALRSGDVGTLEAWTPLLLETGESLSALRSAYAESLNERFRDLAALLIPELEMETRFNPGWREGSSFAEHLAESRALDITERYTHIGPHCFDFRIRANQKMARASLSRGQEKLVLCALALASTSAFESSTGRSCGLVYDDLPAELDRHNIRRVLGVLRDRFSGQAFITGLEFPSPLIDELPESSHVFHVEHGRVNPVI